MIGSASRTLGFLFLASLCLPRVSEAQCYYEVSAYGEVYDDEATEQVYVFGSGWDESQCGGQCYHEYGVMTFAYHNDNSHQTQAPPSETPTTVFRAEVTGWVDWGVVVGVWCSCFQNWVAQDQFNGPSVLVQRSCVPPLNLDGPDFHEWMLSDAELAWPSGALPTDVTDAGSAWTGYTHSWRSADAFTKVGFTDDLRVMLTAAYWGTGTYGATSPGRGFIWLSTEAWAFPYNFSVSNALHEFGHALGYGHKSTNCYDQTIMASGNPSNGVWPTGFGSADNEAMSRDQNKPIQ
jgi:hypothetical protein